MNIFKKIVGKKVNVNVKGKEYQNTYPEVEVLSYYYDELEIKVVGGTKVIWIPQEGSKIVDSNKMIRVFGNQEYEIDIEIL